MSNYVPQVGGEHYQSEYQHWDWASDLQLGYLEGSATKYISRWRKKGRLDDLRKGVSFIEKLIKVTGARRRVLSYSTPTIALLTAQFGQANHLTVAECDCCMTIATWVTVADLVSARTMAEAMVTDAALAKSVPLTEENHHAERQAPPHSPSSPGKERNQGGWPGTDMGGV